MFNGITDGFFHRRKKATYHFEKMLTNRQTSDNARPPGHRYSKEQSSSMKSLSKNTIFIKKINAGYCLLVFVHAIYQILSKYFKPLKSYEVHKIFGLEIRSGEITRKKSNCSSCMWHSYLTWHIYPYQVWSNCLKQFGSYDLHKISVSGEISTYWRKKVVSLAYDTSSGPYLCLYQILSNDFKLCRSYGVHKILG